MPMDKVAALKLEERRQLFQETAARRGMSPAVVEKDFWVCWTLKQIYSNPQLQPHIVFKGGTSLSKVFGLIERFSEDIDLILDWQLLGYGPGQQDPYQDQPSRTQQDRFNEQFNIRAARYIAETLCPQLDQQFHRCSGVAATVDADHPQVIKVKYPAAFPPDYLRPEVQLEIGPLASFVPHESYTIQPYAAQVFPATFDAPNCPVVAIKAERTFWEKATILHQQAHRQEPIPTRYSRHYYDMHQLAGSVVKSSSLADLKLLEDVVAFKDRFYRCPWARYDLARPGTFRLIPNADRLPELRADYRQMAVMIFGPIPEFEHIVASLKLLEKEINGLPIK